MLNTAEHEISTAHKNSNTEMNKVLDLSLSDLVFIMLINCWHFNIYEQDKFRAQLSWAWAKFYNL